MMFGPSQSTWASDPPKLAAVVDLIHSQSPFITTHPESWYSLYHPTEGRRLSRPSWLVTHRDGFHARRQSPIQVLTGSGVDQLRWSDTTRCPYATPPQEKINKSLMWSAVAYCSQAQLTTLTENITLKIFLTFFRVLPTNKKNKKKKKKKKKKRKETKPQNFPSGSWASCFFYEQLSVAFGPLSSGNVLCFVVLLLCHFFLANRFTLKTKKKEKKKKN